MAMTTNPGEVVPRSIGRVLDLLEIVLAENDCNLTTAASRSGLTPTTALRHLRALEARGYISRNSAGVFSAGPTLFRVSAGLRDSGPVDRVITAAQPLLDALAIEGGESCYLSLADGRSSASYIAVAEGTHAIRHVGWVGQHVPLDGTAVGSAFASRGNLAERTGAVEADITALSLALPPHESLDFAVSVLGPAHRMRISRHHIGNALIDAVRALASDLGFSAEEVAS